MSKTSSIGDNKYREVRREFRANSYIFNLSNWV